LTLPGYPARWMRARGGQASVEFALVLPVLVIIAVAICQVALGLNCYLIVTSASREGARRAAETNDPAAARKAASNASSSLPGDKPVIEVSFPEGRAKGSPVRVTVTYKMPLMLPALKRIIPGATFRGSTLMVLERGD
jgi:Flp pilus assembly protein TadG